MPCFKPHSAFLNQWKMPYPIVSDCTGGDWYWASSIASWRNADNTICCMRAVQVLRVWPLLTWEIWEMKSSKPKSQRLGRRMFCLILLSEQWRLRTLARRRQRGRRSFDFTSESLKSVKPVSSSLRFPFQKFGRKASFIRNMSDWSAKKLDIGWKWHLSLVCPQCTLINRDLRHSETLRAAGLDGRSL